MRIDNYMQLYDEMKGGEIRKVKKGGIVRINNCTDKEIENSILLKDSEIKAYMLSIFIDEFDSICKSRSNRGMIIHKHQYIECIKQADAMYVAFYRRWKKLQKPEGIKTALDDFFTEKGVRFEKNDFQEVLLRKGEYLLEKGQMKIENLNAMKEVFGIINSPITVNEPLEVKTDEKVNKPD